MKASVLLPVYNNESNIHKTIDSILNQTFHDFELVIVNDGSTDNTQSILSEYEKHDNRVRVINKKNNSGVIDSLNIGLKECRSEYIIRHDSEDISHIDRFKIQVESLDKWEDISYIATRNFILDVDYNIIGVWPLKNTKNLNGLIDKGKVPIADPSAIFRKKDVIKIGGYSKKAKYCENYDLCIRLRKAGFRFAFINKPLYSFIRGKSGLSYENRALQIINTYKCQGLNISKSIVNDKVREKKIRDKIILGIDHNLDISINKKLVRYYSLKLYNKLLIIKYNRYKSGINI